MKRIFEGRKTIIIDSKLVDKVLELAEDYMARYPDTEHVHTEMETDLKFADSAVVRESPAELDFVDARIRGGYALKIYISNCPDISKRINDEIAEQLAWAQCSCRTPYIDNWYEKDVRMKVIDGRETVTYDMHYFTIREIITHTSDSVEVVFDATDTFAARNFR